MAQPLVGASAPAGAGAVNTLPFSLIAYDEVDSTNTVAKRLCAAEAADQTLVWARRQTAGRGRLRRTWISPTGNLYVSFILRPTVSVSDATALTFVAAVAVAETVAALLPAGAKVRCKWPNDVLVDGRKIAGILLESAALVDGALDWVVVGIGLNVATHPPAETLLYPATSLAAAGAGAVTVEAVLATLCHRVDHWLRQWREAGFAAVRAAWLALAHDLGRVISIGDGDGDDAVSGIFRGLDERGVLLIETGTGLRRISAGDVLPTRPAPA